MNTKEILQGIKNWTAGKLDTKVDKVTGKGLSTNDYTNAEKTKLAGIEEGAGMNLVEGYYYNKKFYKEAAHTTEITGADGRIYIDKDTNREFRWDGTKYQLLKSEVDGSFVSEGTFTYRPTAGALDVESGAVGEGGAQIECVKGNTIAWNQIIQDSVAEETFTVDGTDNFSAFNYRMDFINDHIYYFTWQSRVETSVNNALLPTFGRSPVWGSATSQFLVKQTTSYARYSVLGENTNSDSEKYFSFIMRSYDNGYPDPDTYHIKEVVGIDLTLIYGEGNEPTTPEQFEADYQKWFGKPLTYEEYDEGSLRSVEMTWIKTVGFNQWDEEWEVGSINQNTGQNQNSQNTIRSKNYCPCLPSTNYHIGCASTLIFVIFYDSNKNYISYVNTSANLKYKTIETPSNAAFFKIRGADPDYGTTYNHDICINLSHSGDRNGDYEPYWEHTASLPVTSLKGKLNGEGSSVVIFPDGMKKAGTVYDEIVKRGNQTVAIKRIGAVDLGTQEWMVGSANSFRAPFIPNPVQTGYTKAKFQRYWYKEEVMVENEGEYNFHLPSGGLYLSKGTTFAGLDTQQFKEAVSGVICYYELGTPQEYIIDDIDFPTEYPVDDYGTEEILADSAKSLAPTLDIRYGLNATDTLRNLPSKYVSAVGEQNFTEAQKERARNNIGAASQKEFVKVKKMVEAISPKVDNDYYVDMGLPSGLLWAKRNIFTGTGNDKGFAPSEYTYDASFFSWGNKEGHNPISSSAFDYDFGSSNDGPYASTDGAKLTGNIPLSQDAARYNCGEPWRMPTSAEFQELFDNCDFIDANGDVIASTTTNKLITMNSTVGIRLKSKINGNILFFPCSGNGYGQSCGGLGNHGDYWSGSFYPTANARHLFFNSGGVEPQYSNNRYLGFAVRAVM